MLGAYRLVSLLGRGGMGVVWLGERCDGQFEARAAVKLLDTTRITSGEARFRREANFLARVTHPNIAHLLDAGVASDGQPYLVLELVDGQPLDRYCDDRTLDLPSRIALFLHVLDAVSHAHAQRIVHRDLKPSNVLVRTDGHVKLLDFGVAKLLEHEGEVGIATTLTLEHGRALTPAYAAPEQVEGATITPATDIYALGVLLYVLLTGQHPCGELSSPAAVLKAIVDVDPRPPSAVFAGGDADEHLAAAASRRGTTPRGCPGCCEGTLTRSLRPRCGRSRSNATRPLPNWPTTSGGISHPNRSRRVPIRSSVAPRASAGNTSPSSLSERSRSVCLPRPLSSTRTGTPPSRSEDPPPSHRRPHR